MSAPVNYPALVDDETLWATKNDAVAFFNQFNVADASLNNAGVVKKAASLTVDMPTTSALELYYEIKSRRADGSIQLDAVVPINTTIQSMNMRLAMLINRVTELENNLKAAGILTA